jgi:predicted transcriptional regulator
MFMVKLQVIDEILELLKDSERSLEEVSGLTSLSRESVEKILKFLREESFIEFKDTKFKITERGQKLLDL